MIAWDLGDPNGVMTTNKTFASPSLPFLTTNQRVHPMKGPMTTQTLRGLNGLNPLHWRGDRTISSTSTARLAACSAARSCRPPT